MGNSRIYTVDWENSAVKISQLRQTLKIEYTNKNICVGVRASPHLLSDGQLLQYYSQRNLALPIPRSRLNAKNAPGTRPYCNRLTDKKILRMK